MRHSAPLILPTTPDNPDYRRSGSADFSEQRRPSGTDGIICGRTRRSTQTAATSPRSAMPTRRIRPIIRNGRKPRTAPSRPGAILFLADSGRTQQEIPRGSINYGHGLNINYVLAGLLSLVPAMNIAERHFRRLWKQRPRRYCHPLRRGRAAQGRIPSHLRPRRGRRDLRLCRRRRCRSQGPGPTKEGCDPNKLNKPSSLAAEPARVGRGYLNSRASVR